MSVNVLFKAVVDIKYGGTKVKKRYLCVAFALTVISMFIAACSFDDSSHLSFSGMGKEMTVEYGEDFDLFEYVEDNLIVDIDDGDRGKSYPISKFDCKYYCGEDECTSTPTSRGSYDIRVKVSNPDIGEGEFAFRLVIPQPHYEGETLTIENDSYLEKISNGSVPVTDEVIESFAEKYRGQVIELDCWIVHGSSRGILLCTAVEWNYHRYLTLNVGTSYTKDFDVLKQVNIRESWEGVESYRKCRIKARVIGPADGGWKEISVKPLQINDRY